MSLVVPSSPTEAARSIVLIAIFFLALSKGFHCQTTSKIQLLGSGSTLTEVHKEMANSFIGYKTHTIDVIYDAVGSGKGISNLLNTGDYVFAGTDYGLRASDYAKSPDAQVLPLVASGLGTGDLILTQEALVGIFNGTITKWNDTAITTKNPLLVNINDDVIVVVRNDSSGTTEIFTQGLSSFSKEWASAFGFASSIKWASSLKGRIVYADGAKGVSNEVIQQLGTIGYTTPTTLVEHVPATIYNKNGKPIKPTQDGLSNMLKSNGLSFDKNFTASLINLPGDNSYPFASYSYLVYLSKNMTDCSKAKILYQYLDYGVSNTVSTIIRESGFVPLATDGNFTAAYKKVLNDFTCDGLSLSNANSSTSFPILLISTITMLLWALL